MRIADHCDATSKVWSTFRFVAGARRQENVEELVAAFGCDDPDDLRRLHALVRAEGFDRVALFVELFADRLGAPDAGRVEDRAERREAKAARGVSARTNRADRVEEREEHPLIALVVFRLAETNAEAHEHPRERRHEEGRPEARARTLRFDDERRDERGRAIRGDEGRRRHGCDEIDRGRVRRELRDAGAGFGELGESAACLFLGRRERRKT